MKNINNTCLLCENSPEEGMHLTGQKVINKVCFPYQLCKTCCTIDNIDIDSKISRKNVWISVEKKLMAK